MSTSRRRSPQRNAGAFLSPDGTLPVPMRTLSEELGDGAMEPEEEREPEIVPPGPLQLALGHLPQSWQARRQTLQAHIGWVAAFGAVALYLLVVFLRGVAAE